MKNSQKLTTAQVADQIRLEGEYVALPIDKAGRGVSLYLYDKGVYRPAEATAQTRADLILGDNSTAGRRNDAVATLKERVKRAGWDLDRATSFVNVSNGLLDWRTQRIRPHDSAIVTPWQVPVHYDPTADDSTIGKFLVDLFGDPGVIAVVEEILGLLLIPETKYDVIVFLHGSGANGKSSLLNLTMQLLGRENLTTLPLHDLSSRFAVAEIENKLAAICTDTSARRIRSSELLKQIASGDLIKVERKGKQPYSIRPFARLVYACNELPECDDSTFGYKRRIKVIPFRFRFDGSDPARPRDRDMRDRVWDPWEMSGLLNRAIAGLQRLDANGDFTRCDEIDRASNDYTQTIDSVQAFVTAVGMRPTTQTEALASEQLHSDYQQWCQSRGKKPLASNAFASRFQEIFPTAVKLRTSIDGEQVMRWHGISKANGSQQSLQGLQGESQFVARTSIDPASPANPART